MIKAFTNAYFNWINTNLALTIKTFNLEKTLLLDLVEKS